MTIKPIPGNLYKVKQSQWLPAFKLEPFYARISVLENSIILALNTSLDHELDWYEFKFLYKGNIMYVDLDDKLFDKYFEKIT